MLVDSQNVDDLVSINREITRLTVVILDSLERRKALKKRLGDLFHELEQKQQRLPFDEAEATERPPAPAPSSNGTRRKRRPPAAVQA